MVRGCEPDSRVGRGREERQGVGRVQHGECGNHERGEAERGMQRHQGDHDRRPFGRFDQPDEGDGDRMLNLATLIPEPKRFSRIYRGRMELIDHIFVSHYLVTGTHTTDVTTVAAAPGIPSVEDNPNEQKGTPGSDHAAVVATFDF